MHDTEATKRRNAGDLPRRGLARPAQQGLTQYSCFAELTVATKSAPVIKLLDKAALLSIARYCDHPVAFLVGAPLSSDAGGGVPGVAPMLTLVREEITKRAATELARYDAMIATRRPGGDAYQAAMEWLQGNVGQPAVNRVIEAAVLRARIAGAAPNFPKNGKDSDWYIPAGTRQLAQLVCRDLSLPMPHFPGPILTTNFDPLLSLAIESCKARAHWRVIQSDGKLADVGENGAVEVIHLHGFWRGSDTLHTSVQLTSPRPALRDSLRKILKQKTLIVVAYGGWDDVFARALAEVAVDDDAQLNVIWCFREADEAEVNLKYKELFERVAPAITRGRFLCYGGIDCHSIFGEIVGLAPSVSVVPAVVASPIAGWDLIDVSYLAGLPPLRADEVIRYFDGATPTWRHANCADIPRRAAVAEICRRLADVRTAKSGCSFQLIRAAGGEGKTTVLLQAAAIAAKGGDWNVLWRPTSRVGLPPAHISALVPTEHWLIVADDAENLVRDLCDAARFLHERGHCHVHFLLAARDTDWRYFEGDRQPWATLAKRHPDVVLRELREDDANVLVAAWRKYGHDGLRELVSLPDAEKQVIALLHAVQGAATHNEGSFFGGLLAVRFGPDGLRNHVVALLDRLKDARIEKSDHNLFDALLYVAACHAVGIPGLDENVLADLVGVDRERVQTLVVNPLGEEAAAVRSAGHVLTRHSKVAAAILVAAEQDFRADIAEVWSAIVRQTVLTSRDIRLGDSFSQVVHASVSLQRDLPCQLPEQRRKGIAIMAAKAAVAAEPDRLCTLVDLGRTYRSAGDPVAAINVFRANVSSLGTKVDYESDVRGYWFEWGVAEGSVGVAASHRGADAWLQGLSLADHLKAAPITPERAKLSCAGLGLAFGKLAEPHAACPFARARRASAYLGRLTDPDPRTLGFFDTHDRDADRIHTPYPGSIEEAIGWLKTAVGRVGHELQDPFLKALLKPEHVSFKMLCATLSTSEVPHSRPNQTRQPLAPRIVPISDPKLLKWRQPLDDKIKDGIARVQKEAWEAVPDGTAAEERFTTARHAASQIISRLSPKIRKQVGAHFETQKWAPLRGRDPKA